MQLTCPLLVQRSLAHCRRHQQTVSHHWTMPPSVLYHCWASRGSVTTAIYMYMYEENNVHGNSNLISLKPEENYVSRGLISSKPTIQSRCTRNGQYGHSCTSFGAATLSPEYNQSQAEHWDACELVVSLHGWGLDSETSELAIDRQGNSTTASRWVGAWPYHKKIWLLRPCNVQFNHAFLCKQIKFNEVLLRLTEQTINTNDMIEINKG